MNKNVRLIFSVLCCTLPYVFGSHAQSRTVLSGAVYMVIDNQAKLVVENSATNAISNLGTGGILTESEFDQVIWNIGTQTGNYQMPFVSQTTLTQIPFNASITTAGSGAGKIFFSTYPGPTWDNDIYKPSDVTHMYDYFSASTNNSNHVIDRFWIIDAQGYTLKPSATFGFTYRDIEHSLAANTIVEANLGAQRFNSATAQWGDYLPQGTTNTALNTTTNVPVSPANFFRSWTLSETTNPLAVDVLVFTASCKDQQVLFDWQTNSELGVDYFEIEYFNETGYESVGIIEPTPGYGLKEYTHLIATRTDGIFRLCEVDIDGIKTEKAALSISCSEFDEYISYNNEQLTVNLFAAYDSEEPLLVYDMAGRLVHQLIVDVKKGENVISIPNISFSTGMYMVDFGVKMNNLRGKVMIE
jgi:hypothetical protein